MPTAVDIVLEVPQELSKEVIALNRKLDEKPNRIALSHDKAVPHITLAMGVVEDRELEAVKAMLDQEFGYLEKFSCQVGPVMQRNDVNGQWVALLAVERCDEIMYMHENAMGILSEVGFVVPTMGALADYQTADAHTLETIQAFKDRNSYQHFSPHITLGFGSLPGTVTFEPRRVEFSSVGLYHLGDHATCRNRLHQVALREENTVAGGGF